MKSTSLLKVLPLLLSTIVVLTACTNSSSTHKDTPLAQQLRGIYANQPLVDLAANYLEPYPNKLEDMVNGKDSTLFHAMAAYEAGDFTEAVKLFPNYSHRPEQVGYIHLYKGISELMSGKQYDAFKSFQRIPSKYEEAFDVSNWYLAMNQIIFDNEHFIKEKLKQIIEKNGYGADRAPQLLKDLEQLKNAQSSK